MKRKILLLLIVLSIGTITSYSKEIDAKENKIININTVDASYSSMNSKGDIEIYARVIGSGISGIENAYVNYGDYYNRMEIVEQSDTSLDVRVVFEYDFFQINDDYKLNLELNKNSVEGAIFLPITSSSIHINSNQSIGMATFIKTDEQNQVHVGAYEVLNVSNQNKTAIYKKDEYVSAQNLVEDSGIQISGGVQPYEYSGSVDTSHYVENKEVVINISDSFFYKQNKEIIIKFNVGYKVNTCKDLESIGKGNNYPGATHLDSWPLNGDYILMTDIDCSATQKNNINHDTSIETTYGDDGFDIIAKNDEEFNGTIEGNGYKITGLEINLLNETVTEETTNIGLIGMIGSDGKILNLIMENISINYSYNFLLNKAISVGAIAGKSEGEITNSGTTGVISGVVNSNNLYVGGLVGTNKGILNSTYSNVDLKAGVGGSFGGLVGYNSGTITNAYATGDIKPIIENEYPVTAGGLVGTSNEGKVRVTYATGDVYTSYEGGGLIGYASCKTANCELKYSYATGNIYGGEDDYLGGVIGFLEEEGDTLMYLNKVYSYEDQLINSNPINTITGEANIISNYPNYRAIVIYANLRNKDNWYSDIMHWDTNNTWSVGQVDNEGKIIYPHLKKINNDSQKNIVI